MHNAKHSDMKRTLLLITLLLTMSFAGLSQNPLADITCAPNEILYTTKYGYSLQGGTFETEGFGGYFIKNTYKNGVGKLTFDFDITQIPEGAFAECQSLNHIKLPNSVTEIGNYAFSGCSSLKSITIPNSVTSIGWGAFDGCSSLTSLTIPNGVTSIGEGVFCGCSSLASITIPNSVTWIGSYAFHNCSSLTCITIPNGVTEIGDGAFSCCTSLRRFNSKYASEDGRCLIFDGWLMAFAPAGLTKYTIPNSVTDIGWGAFHGCSSLKSITIHESVTSIGWDAFKNCSSLTSITIPESVTSIGWEAFSGCSSLKSITIPDGVNAIGYEFYNCSSLAEVYCKPTTPPSIEGEVFYNNASGRKIYVPAESVDAYKTDQCWSQYADSIVGYDFE